MMSRKEILVTCPWDAESYPTVDHEEQDWADTMANGAAKDLQLIDEQGAILKQKVASMNATRPKAAFIATAL